MNWGMWVSVGLVLGALASCSDDSEECECKFRGLSGDETTADWSCTVLAGAEGIVNDVCGEVIDGGDVMCDQVGRGQESTVSFGFDPGANSCSVVDFTLVQGNPPDPCGCSD